MKCLVALACAAAALSACASEPPRAAILPPFDREEAKMASTRLHEQLLTAEAQFEPLLGTPGAEELFWRLHRDEAAAARIEDRLHE